MTELVTGLDLVEVQLGVALGRSLAELQIASPPPAVGRAVQARVCMERYDHHGAPIPTHGVLHSFQVPSGPGIRVDSFGEVGLVTSALYDALLAKVIVHSRSTEPGVVEAKAARALADLRTEGVLTNADALIRILGTPEVLAGGVDVAFLEARPGLLSGPTEPEPDASPENVVDDPLAVLQVATPLPRQPITEPSSDALVIRASVPGTVVDVAVSAGMELAAGASLLVVESMKMEHLLVAQQSLRVVAVLTRPGSTVAAGDPVISYVPVAIDTQTDAPAGVVDPGAIRRDLAESIARHEFGLDEHRPDAVARRHSTGHRTARENIDDLLDEGSFVEYAPLVVAAQRRRRSLEDLIRRTPGDGLVGGVGTVNAMTFGPETSKVVALTYDYSVLAGTQGLQNHRKKDRLFELAERLRLPVVLFAEGGGGRPGDTDGTGSQASTAWPSISSADSAGWCRSSASSRGTASPATPPCSAPATWSSPPPELEHRHGRPGHDRRRRTRGLPPERDRAGRRPGAQRCRRSRGGRRSSGGSRRHAVPVVLPGCSTRPGSPATNGCSERRSPRTGYASTTSGPC